MHDPRVVSRDEWLAARRELLAEEKEFTRQRDALNTRRRELPMVEIDRDYIFRCPDGQASLPDLFNGRGQLLVYHFMFDPDWDEGCPSCSFLADGIGHLAHLHARDTTLVMVSLGAAAQARGIPAADGLDRALVLLFRQRFQLRLPRHPRPGRGPGRVQLPRPRRARTRLAPVDRQLHGVSAILRRGNRVSRPTPLRRGTHRQPHRPVVDLTARDPQEMGAPSRAQRGS